MCKKICLDAGHYGSKYNRSPVAPAYYESEAMWKLHLLLKKELEAFGFEVITTRDDQAKNPDLAARGKTAKGCDLFLSLHSNACNTESVDRVVGIYQVPDADTTHDEKSKPIADLLAAEVARVMGTKDAPQTYSRLADTDKDGDGKKDDNYYGVLNGADAVGAPGVLLEHSFHTNTRAAKWLLDDNNLAKLAKAEAEALAAHFGMQKKDTGIRYRVQVGSFANKAYAEAMLKKLKAAGFEGYITTYQKES